MRLSCRIVVVLAAIAVMGSATTSCTWLTERSGTARALLWMDADMGDINRFPARHIAASPRASAFHTATAGRYDSVFAPLVLTTETTADTIDFDQFLANRSTYSFLVARSDTLLFEQYYQERDERSIETTFSVSKSLVSIGVGLAIDRGLIGSVNDPVTQYVPELLERDERFGHMTVRHLLTMSAGIQFKRSKMPWGDEARSYYSPDLRAVALGLEIAADPGAEFLYNFYNPILMGLVLERATGSNLSELLEEGMWGRIGTESAASWSLDSERHGFEKMESGFNAVPRDLLRLGSLFERGGTAGGERILSEEWVAASVRADSVSDPALNYGYFWWVRPSADHAPSYYAEGRFGQFIYVIPHLNLVMVRTGADDGDVSWPSVFERIARRIEALEGVG